MSETIIAFAGRLRLLGEIGSDGLVRWHEWWQFFVSLCFIVLEDDK